MCLCMHVSESVCKMFLSVDYSKKKNLMVINLAMHVVTLILRIGGRRGRFPGWKLMFELMTF